MTHLEQICASRKFCADCRSRPAWRQAFGAPEICPFLEGAEVLAHVPVPIVYTVEDALAVCASCPKLRPDGRCTGCGCKSEMRMASETRICPDKKFIRKSPSVD
jgi:hypothetical protein